MKIRIHKNVLPCQMVSTGILGQYVNALEEAGMYSYVEECYENENGQLVHDYFAFEREEG